MLIPGIPRVLYVQCGYVELAYLLSRCQCRRQGVCQTRDDLKGESTPTVMSGTNVLVANSASAKVLFPEPRAA